MSRVTPFSGHSKMWVRAVYLSHVTPVNVIRHIDSHVIWVVSRLWILRANCEFARYIWGMSRLWISESCHTYERHGTRVMSYLWMASAKCEFVRWVRVMSHVWMACHMSHVTWVMSHESCHMSHVTWVTSRMSHVTWVMSHVSYIP